MLTGSCSKETCPLHNSPGAALVTREGRQFVVFIREPNTLQTVPPPSQDGTCPLDNISPNLVGGIFRCAEGLVFDIERATQT